MLKETPKEKPFEWFEWIDAIDNKIQELYYIDQFDLAKKCEELLLKAKIALEDTNLTDDFVKKSNIIKYLVDLEWEIDQFFIETGNEQKEIKYGETIHSKIDEILANIEEKTTKQCFEELSLVLEDSKKHEYNDIAKRRIAEKIAKVVLRIQEEQARRKEEIDIDVVENFCTKEDLIEAIKEDLIENAQTQSEEDRLYTLELAKNLSTENLKDTEIWELVAQVEYVKFANSAENKKNLPEILEDKKNLPDIPKKEWNWQEIKDKIGPFLNDAKQVLEDKIGLFFHDTKLVLGYLDEETGEYKSNEIVYCNLKDIDKLDLRKKIRLIELKTRAKRMNYKFKDYKVLQKVELLDGVKEITEFAFYLCHPLKEVKIGKGLKNIPQCCFHETSIERVQIPSNVREIDYAAFARCPLKEVLFEEGLEIIRNCAFQATELERFKNTK